MCNLLVISPRYPHRRSYSASFVKVQVDLLSKYLKSVTVISLIPYVPKIFRNLRFINPKWVGDSYASDYSYNNVSVYYIRSANLPWDFCRRNFYVKSQSRKVINHIKRNNIEFDLVHSHFIWPSGYVGVHVKKVFSKPLVVTAHGYDIYKLPFKNKKWTDIIKSILSDVDYLISVNKKNIRYIKKLGVEIPVVPIPNGYDSNLFRPLDREECRKLLGLPLNKKIILTVGNLYKVKGHKYLLEALRYVVKKRNDMLSIIIGEGPEREFLRKLIEDWNLSKYVLMAGPKPHEEIPMWMNAADIFVLPSLAEGNPTVMFESLGCGLPFVGTRVGGIPEVIISDDYGYLVDPMNSRELYEKIILSLDREWDRRKIHNYALQFTSKNAVKKIMEVYDEVLG